MGLSKDHLEGVIIMLKDEFKSVINQSHERCQLMNLSKDLVFSQKILDDVELQQKFAQKRSMIQTASPYMEHLINIVKGYNFFALLTDEEGCILAALGDDKILGEAFRLKMVPGAYMDEESIGTNAMAVVIKTNGPVQLSGEDHYIKEYYRWTCSAAPIKDSNGNLIGVLNLTGYTEQVHPHTLGMVIAAANAIEEMIRAKRRYKLRAVNNKHIETIFNSMPVAIISSDFDGKIKLYNYKASLILGDGENNIKWTNMNEFLSGWDSLKESLVTEQNAESDIYIATSGSSNNYHVTASSIYNPIDNSVDIISVFEKVKAPRKEVFFTFDQIIGQDPNFEKIVTYSKKIANSKSAVLIMGETGTGKNSFAQAIHNYSQRMDGPFVTINCGALPKQLMDIELFGYEEGAYHERKGEGNTGKFEMADGGTILLNEIDELSLDIQIKVQKVLQEGVVVRIGSQTETPVNVRVIATTHKDLKKEVELGRFRKDLFYRLSVLPLLLPPLRQRKGDIKLLVNYFMKQISNDLGKHQVEVPSCYMTMMNEYDWPGNVRELKNVIELIINTETVPVEYFTKYQQEHDLTEGNEKLDLAYIEKEHITRVIRMNNGNISRSAKDLGIRRNTLYNKIKKYELEV